MNRKATSSIVAIVALVGLSSLALGQDARQSAAAKGAISLDSIPASDEELRRLGVKKLTAAQVNRMMGTLHLLSLSRVSGTGGRGSNYTCTTDTNTCTCHGWLDCHLADMDECKTSPANPDGTLCSGTVPCTCTWH